jgi:hypothetical protein
VKEKKGIVVGRFDRGRFAADPEVQELVRNFPKAESFEQELDPDLPAQVAEVEALMAAGKLDEATRRIESEFGIDPSIAPKRVTVSPRTGAGLMLEAQLAAARVDREGVKEFLQWALHDVRDQRKAQRTEGEDRKVVIDRIMWKLGTYACDEEIRSMVEEYLYYGGGEEK